MTGFGVETERAPRVAVPRRPRPAPPDVRARPRPAHRPDRTERSRTAHTHGWRLARDPRPFASPDLHMRVYQRASASHVPRVPRGSLRHALDARAPLPRTRATRVAISAPHGAGASAPAGSKLKFWRSDLWLKRNEGLRSTIFRLRTDVIAEARDVAASRGRGITLRRKRGFSMAERRRGIMLRHMSWSRYPNAMP